MISQELRSLLTKIGHHQMMTTHSQTGPVYLMFLKNVRQTEYNIQYVFIHVKLLVFTARI